MNTNAVLISNTMIFIKCLNIVEAKNMGSTHVNNTVLQNKYLKKDVLQKTTTNVYTHAYPVGWTPHPAALV